MGGGCFGQGGGSTANGERGMARGKGVVKVWTEAHMNTTGFQASSTKLAAYRDHP